jgi:hypothetical protein
MLGPVTWVDTSDINIYHEQDGYIHEAKETDPIKTGELECATNALKERRHEHITSEWRSLCMVGYLHAMTTAVYKHVLDKM